MYRLGARLFLFACLAVTCGNSFVAYAHDDEEVYFHEGGAEFYSNYDDDINECFARECCSECDCYRPNCCCLSDNQYWLRGDALLWWTRGMSAPPLASASPPGTSVDDAGVLGTPGARILFGGDSSILNDSRWGGRIQGGGWLDCSKQIALEGDWLDLRGLTENFQASSDGSDIISRPYFDAVTQMNAAELVSYPDVLAGKITVSANNDFQSGGARLRWNLGCKDLGCGNVSRWHLLTGYRYSRLNEGLVIREELESLDPQNPGTFDLHDRFLTRNTFQGGEVGMVYQAQKGRLNCELLTRLAVGATEQQVTISGDTVTDDGITTQKYQGGLLAQRTNIGTYQRNRISAIPEIGLTVGYQLGRGWTASLGYTAILWSRVVRAGDQIDRTVDPRLIPPENPPVPDATRPGFTFRDSVFWAQGVNFGLSYRW